MEKSREKKFIKELKRIETIKNQSPVRIEDVDQLLDAGFKLSLEFERVYKSREKWRARAEAAEAKLL